MSTSNVIDLELDDLPPPRYGQPTVWPRPTGQSRVRYSEQQGNYAPPQNPTPQIVAEILQACTQGDLYKVTHYGSTYDLNVGDYDRRCPIHLASAEGQTLIVKYLISRGVNVNCEDRFGNTPLLEALRGNHAEVAKMLRDAGAKMGQASAEIDGEVMRGAAANDVEKLLSPPASCCICVEPYNEGNHCPRVLTCGHSVCETCLRQLIGGRCAECRCQIKFSP